MTKRADEDFLVHLQQRFSLTEEGAVTTLAGWLSSYEPGPAALAHMGSSFTYTHDHGGDSQSQTLT